MLSRFVILMRNQLQLSYMRFPPPMVDILRQAVAYAEAHEIAPAENINDLPE